MYYSNTPFATAWMDVVAVMPVKRAGHRRTHRPCFTAPTTARPHTRGYFVNLCPPDQAWSDPRMGTISGLVGSQASVPDA